MLWPWRIISQHAANADAGPWTNDGIFPSSRNITLTNLERAKDVWVRVRAIGRLGPGGWSDPATILVI
jgi:hypothetical protein